MVRITSLLFCSILLASTSTAHALDLYGIDLKVGVRGGLNMSFLPEPSDLNPNSRYIPQGTFFGAGWDVGAALQFRTFGIAGIEIGWLRTYEQAEASIAFEGVIDCSQGGGRCPVQELGAAMDFHAHHIPLTLHLSLPTGKARPFMTLGADFVVRRMNRNFELRERSPFPEDLDEVADADLLRRWGESVEAQYLFNATLREENPEFQIGIIVGAGLNIAARQFELPVEFRLNIYPSTGKNLADRGDFPSTGATTYDPNFQVRYNDSWNYQLFVLFGFDYLIF